MESFVSICLGVALSAACGFRVFVPALFLSVAAGSIQALTVGARALSLGTTGGLANPIVSTLEAGGAAVLSALAVLVPILAFLLFLGTALFLACRLLRKA